MAILVNLDLKIIESMILYCQMTVKYNLF